MSDKIKKLLRGCEWVLIPALILLSVFYGGMRWGEKKALDGMVAKRDTVTKIVSVYKNFPEPQKTALVGYFAVPRYKFLTDTLKSVETLVLHDTTLVYLPREQRYYEEDSARVRIWISGYEPRLDRYEFDIPTTTVTTTVVQRASRWGLSINAGYGFSLHDKIVYPSPYIGVGISYTILRL